jgi:hypothetical protein
VFLIGAPRPHDAVQQHSENADPPTQRQRQGSPCRRSTGYLLNGICAQGAPPGRG